MSGDESTGVARSSDQPAHLPLVAMSPTGNEIPLNMPLTTMTDAVFIYAVDGRLPVMHTTSSRQCRC